MSAPVIEVEGLRKAYGATVAVDGVSLTVRRGQIVGILGPGWYGTGVPTFELLVMGGWTVVCVPVAARIFRWS